MKIKLLLYTVPLLFSACTSSPQRYTTWQRVQQSQLGLSEKINLTNALVKVTEITERNKTARAFRPQQKKLDCKDNNKQDIPERIKGPEQIEYSKGKGNDSNDIVLEGMNVITYKLSELMKVSENGNNDCEDNLTPLAQQGNPVTINANGSTGGITINIGSPGAIATTNELKKEDSNTVPVFVTNPPKSNIQSFWDDIFGYNQSNNYNSHENNKR